MLQRQTLSLNFRSYSPINVCHCGNIYLIFGHVHKIRSYSFGQVNIPRSNFSFVNFTPFFIINLMHFKYNLCLDCNTNRTGYHNLAFKIELQATS